MSASLLQTSVPLNQEWARVGSRVGRPVREKLAESEVAQRAQLPVRGRGSTPGGGHLLTRGGSERADKVRPFRRHLVEPRQQPFEIVPAPEQGIRQRQLDP